MYYFDLANHFHHLNSFVIWQIFEITEPSHSILDKSKEEEEAMLVKTKMAILPVIICIRQDDLG